MEDISKNIINQAVKGDAEAFEIIYKATSKYVYTVALRITNNLEDAEDVTQDVFLKIFKNINKFNFHSSLKTWIYRITVNASINACKKESKEMDRRDEYIIDVNQHPSEEKELDEIKESNENLIASLLEILNPDQRACMVLREIEGLNYKEIAKILKVNINTIRSRLKRARDALLTYGKGKVKENEM